jgi:hypothetical protein
MSSLLAGLSAVCLIATTHAACARASATDRPEGPSAQAGPCVTQATDGVFGMVKLHLLRQGYGAADVEMVTDSTTCAAGVAAYNAGLPASATIAAAYIIRRGSDGFVLVLPSNRDTHIYYTTSWELEKAVQAN